MQPNLTLIPGDEDVVIQKLIPETAPFVMVTGMEICDSRLTPSERLLWIWLRFRSFNSGETTVGYRAIAQDLGMSLSSIKRMTRKLASMGRFKSVRRAYGGTSQKRLASTKEVYGDLPRYVSLMLRANRTTEDVQFLTSSGITDEPTRVHPRTHLVSPTNPPGVTGEPAYLDLSGKIISTDLTLLCAASPRAAKRAQERKNQDDNQPEIDDLVSKTKMSDNIKNTSEIEDPQSSQGDRAPLVIEKKNKAEIEAEKKLAEQALVNQRAEAFRSSRRALIKDPDDSADDRVERGQATATAALALAAEKEVAAQAKRAERAEKKRQAQMNGEVHAGIRKVNQDQVREINSTEVREWYMGGLKEKFGPAIRAPLWGAKEKGLALRLLTEFGPSIVQKGIAHVCANWDDYKKRWKKEGIPDIGFIHMAKSDIFGFVQVQQSKASATTTANAVKNPKFI